MQPPNDYNPIDYLVIGHLTRDLTPRGSVTGGTAAYAALTALAMGLRVGIVTAWDERIELQGLSGIPIAGLEVDQATTFENLKTGNRRDQVLHHIAPPLDYYLIPDPWRSTPMIHLAPVAQEVEPTIINHFQDKFIGATPQGWLRERDPEGRVRPAEWPEFAYVLNRIGCAVISTEDVGNDLARIEEMAAASKLLVVTEADQGARVYFAGEVRHFPAPEFTEVDATGSGDIFAAVFFNHYHLSLDPWESTQLAIQVASRSITREGLSGAPTPEEIRTLYSEPIL